MRRVSLAGAAVVLTILLVGGVALAKTVQCQVNTSCIGTNKDDLLIGTSGSDNMQGFGGNDVLKGRGGNDNTLRGDKGADRIFGGPGFDFIEGGPGKDVLKGGADGDAYFFGQNWGKETIVDTPIIGTNLDLGHFVRFDNVTDNLTINLNSRSRAPEIRNASKTSILNWEDNLIDGVVDGKGDDKIIGRDVNDNLQPFAGGVDIIKARGGDDFVYTLDGVAGDQIDCGDGNDRVTKDAGDTAINCEQGG